MLLTLDSLHRWFESLTTGLPQKAGFPQEKINEVHGAWYDPSNPVVKYCGSLRSAEAEWMEEEAEAADLVLVMGTSLGGLYADCVATRCANRASMDLERGAADPYETCLGTVIINLQQTAQDRLMTLNFKSKSDDLLVKLAAALGLASALPAHPKTNARFSTVQCALVPYDCHGLRLPPGSAAPKMWLDLQPGAKVRLLTDKDGAAAHNCQGAKQPNTIHIGSTKGQMFADKPIPRAGSCPGYGTVKRREEETATLFVDIEGVSCRLGLWWLEAAARGGPAKLPLVNQSPKYEGTRDPSGGKKAAIGSADAAGGKGKAKAKA